MRLVAPFGFALLWASTVAVALSPSPSPSPAVTLEQVMADPDWIGPAVESAHWSLDGRSVLYTAKRAGSPLRDTFRLDLAGGAAARVPDDELSTLDGARPVYDPARRRALFVRHGDVFLRELDSGRLLQLTRSEASERSPQFSADGRQVHYRIDTDWHVYDLQARVGGPLLQLRAKDDPEQKEPDALRERQLRQIQTLALEEQEDAERRERDRALRAADPSRPPPPVWLGEVTIADSALSPDGRWAVVATEASGENGRAGSMPKYVTASGYEEIEATRVRVGRKPPRPQSFWLVEVASGEKRPLALSTLPGITQDPLAEMRAAAKLEALAGERAVRLLAVQWNRPGSAVALMLRAVDNKDRWIATVDLQEARLATQHRLTDAAWINWNFNDFGWLHDERTLWYLSEEDGYSHLYTRIPGQAAQQRTRGAWEVSSPQLDAAGTAFLFLCNRNWPGDYELCRLDLDGDRLTELTALDGVEGPDSLDLRPEPLALSGFALSPDGRQVLLRHSRSYLPAQLALVAVEGGPARILTDTRSEAYKAIAWQAPQFVPVPSSQVAAPLWSKLYRPPSLEPGRKYPIVLFVHGAGYTQNTHAKYPYYFREQMFHHLLAQQGYLVLDIDYRASEGYGRDWRSAIYRRMGHPELEDLIDGVNWLVREQQGDAANVGVYGGSYGGFMALMAMFRAPEVFHAGAALRPVTDWTQYNHGYSANILNTPELDPEAYRISSPIEHAAGLRGHLLIAHGMLDDNVFFQDSVRLAQRLIELKKEHWELASYPLERHSFVRADAWLDEYRRVHALFERVLRD